MSKVSTYEGCHLFSKEARFLVDLKSNLNGVRLPFVEKLNKKTVGFFCQDNHVLKLSLPNLDLESIPNSIGVLQDLVYLDLRKNNLRSLPESFSKLKHLKELHLEDNSFQTIPASVGNLKCLAALYLRSNQIAFLPDWIVNLPKLKLLNVGNNRLNNLPDSISELKSLNHLYLKNNPLFLLPESILDLEKTRIYLDDDCPQAFPPNARGKDWKFIAYFQKLKHWNPNQVVKKITINEPLTDFDTNNHKVGKYFLYILQKTEGIDNSTKRKFLEIVGERFDLPLNQSGFDLKL